MNDLIAILKQDYQTFPDNQTYSIYAPDVYFEDPMNQFRGIDQYQKMIQFIKRTFKNPKLDLLLIEPQNNIIKTEWVLTWTTPLPWKPQITIPGWSELTINPDHKIIIHKDHWKCTRLAVLKQHFNFH